ncbi:MAG: sigma factor-like helix-turn-helix DNA-binding protein [Actinomycetes bacterium]
MVVDVAEVLRATERGQDREPAVDRALQRLLASDDAHRLLTALAGVPVDQRHAVVLAGSSGSTAREIAALEHVPLGTAKTRVRSGLRRLRAELAAEDPSLGRGG